VAVAVEGVSEARTRRAAQAVAEYIERHPLAADNELGIAQVWLPGMGVDEPLASVRSALVWLVEQGVMERVALADGGAIYRAAPAAPAA
jgi:Fe2+ or Zn2+ uptake regulation protein